MKLQVPCGRAELEETSVQTAHRETYEETGLSIPHKRFKVVAWDPEYDCQVFEVRLTEEELPERTEPEKMGSWLLYPWKSFKLVAQQGKTTPSLTKFLKKILE